MKEMPGLQTLTKSRLHAFRKCRRYHKLAYIDGWRPASAGEPLTFGTMFHDGIESWWRSGTLSFPESDDAVLSVKVREILLAYVKYGWPDRDDFEVLAVERSVRWPLINPESMMASRIFEMGGVLDLVLRRRATGETLLVEHKTTGSDFSDDSADYWNRLAMDPQLSIYVVACESLGLKVDRIIYDVVARPMLRLREATPLESRKYTKDGNLYANQRDFDESIEEYTARLHADIESRPERYCGRREIARTESEIRDGMLDTWQEAKAMREAELSGRHPRNPDACHQYSKCPMYDICAYGVDPAQSALYVKVENLHPELEGVSK